MRRRYLLLCLLGSCWFAPVQAQSEAAIQASEQEQAILRAAPPAYLRRAAVDEREDLAAVVLTGAEASTATANGVVEVVDPARELPRLTRPDGKQVKSLAAHLDSLPSLLTVGSSLAIVLGLFCVTAWFMKRGQPGGAKFLPHEAVSVLGRQALPGRQQMILVRCGSKLLLVAVSMHGAETLTEITDPQEVDRLAGLCGQSDRHGVTASFNELMSQWGNEEPTRSRGSLFSRRKHVDSDGLVDSAYG